MQKAPMSRLWNDVKGYVASGYILGFIMALANIGRMPGPWTDWIWAAIVIGGLGSGPICGVIGFLWGCLRRPRRVPAHSAPVEQPYHS